MSQSDYLTPDPLFIEKMKVNLPPCPVPRNKAVESEETIGIYSYIDQDTMDEDYVKQALEAIESGEFNKVPEEIINWYNSLPQDNEESPETQPVKRYYCSNDFELKNPTHEYVDLDKDKLSASPTDGEEIGDAIRRPKRFQKGERIDFIKSRLSQFLTNNFRGIKMPSRREDSKRSETRSNSNSDWSEDDKFRGMIYSNSFDDSTASNYIENPSRRLSTEVFISQMPPPFPSSRRDTFLSYLNSNDDTPKRNLMRTFSKSLENLQVSCQRNSPPPKPPHRDRCHDADAYLVPAHLSIPSPPPRVSSRQKETLWNTNLTQEYIQPRAIIHDQSLPPYIPKTSRTRQPVTENEPGELYLLPKDTPPTPMPRFTNNASISSVPVLSPATHYSDPLDFSVTYYSDRRKSDAKPPIFPKPFTPQLPNKPVPAPKPKCLPIKKHVSPKFIEQNSLQSQGLPREIRNSN